MNRIKTIAIVSTLYICCVSFSYAGGPGGESPSLPAKKERNLYGEVFSEDPETRIVLDRQNYGQKYSYTVGKDPIPLTEEESRKSPIIKFYLGKGYDQSGRTLDEVLNLRQDELEDNHDFIQWIFPSFNKSGFSEHAPTLTNNDIKEFQSSAKLRNNLRQSLDVMLGFYGFKRETLKDGTVLISKGPNFVERTNSWIEPDNHNFLRITRILKSLRVLGLEDESRAFYAALKREFSNGPKRQIIGDRTFRFWRNAAGVFDEPEPQVKALPPVVTPPHHEAPEVKEIIPVLDSLNKDPLPNPKVEMAPRQVAEQPPKWSITNAFRKLLPSSWFDSPPQENALSKQAGSAR